jgi:hypothetical protein
LYENAPYPPCATWIQDASFLVNSPDRKKGYVVKFTRVALSIPLVLLAGVPGVAGSVYLMLAIAISLLADRVYGKAAWSRLEH